ncbi:hypothetical protein VPH35_126394 [Triticum aestivum]
MAAASDAFSATNHGSQGRVDHDLGDFFDKLDLHEEEFEDVVVEEEAPELLEEIRWLALARVHTRRNFSQSAFYKDMRAAWNCAQAVRFRPIGPNLFERIMSQGPWLFRNMAVPLTPYDGFSNAEEVPIVHMPIWLQIHKLPDGYCRQDLIAKLLRSVGEVLETRITGNSRGDYVRVRVQHDIRKPLTKFVSIVKGKTRNIYAHKECGDGVFLEKDLKFGDYLYADPPVRVRSDWEPSRGERKINNDLMVPKSAACKGEAMADGELKDTASSPLKSPSSLDMDLDKSSRKRLNMDVVLVTPPAAASTTPAGKVLLITDAKVAADSVSTNNSTGSKRAKMDGENSNSEKVSAGSQEERRQSQ